MLDKSDASKREGVAKNTTQVCFIERHVKISNYKP